MTAAFDSAPQREKFELSEEAQLLVPFIVFEPEFKCYATMPLSRAMRKYPMDKCCNSEKSEKLY